MTKIFRLILSFTIILMSSCATGLINYQQKSDLNQEYKQIFEEMEDNINGIFPNEVSIKTKSQTFNTYYDFQLYNGKIYYIGLNGHKPEEWTKLKRTGLPRNFFERGFINPDRIVAISADANLLVALSEKGIFYYMMCTRELTASPFEWIQKKGFPLPMTLQLDGKLNNYKDWSLGRRGNEVLWYEDINGNQHHYGTMGIQHNYLLLEDGQEIRFSDTGLPADFSHNVLGPERGKFIAESLSASGTTLFVINKAGEMYTRLADFDSLGSDPMFYKYTYDQSYRDLRPGSNYKTNFNYWALPAEDWLRQVPIPLTGQAALTDKITILQNGKGNESRELRVAGLNPAGETGYYFKKIFGTSWQFKSSALKLDGLYLPEPTETLKASLRGNSPDRDLTGKLWNNNQSIEDISVSLSGFNLLEGSCNLLVCRGSEEISIPFHTVEMWYYMKRDRPGRDGTFKLLVGTLVINQFELSRYSEGFQKVINSYFTPFDRGTFNFYIKASEGIVTAESIEKNGKKIRMLFSENTQDLKLNPSILLTENLTKNDSLVQLYLSDELTVPDPLMAAQNQKGELIDKIYRNQVYLDAVKETLKEQESRQFSSNLSNSSYSGFELFLYITGLSKVDFPKFYTISMHFNPILDSIKDSVNFSYTTKTMIYGTIINHVERRIEYYKALINPDNTRPFYFAETTGEYFEKIQMPREFLPISGAGFFPDFIFYNKKINTHSLIEIPDLESEIAEYLSDNSLSKKPLKLKILLMNIEAGSNMKRREAQMIFDGQNMEIR